MLQLQISWLYKYFKIEPIIHDLHGNGNEEGVLWRGIIGITLKKKVNFLVAALVSQLISSFINIFLLIINLFAHNTWMLN